MAARAMVATAACPGLPDLLDEVPAAPARAATLLKGMHHEERETCRRTMHMMSTGSISGAHGAAIPCRRIAMRFGAIAVPCAFASIGHPSPLKPARSPDRASPVDIAAPASPATCPVSYSAIDRAPLRFTTNANTRPSRRSAPIAARAAAANAADHRSPNTSGRTPSIAARRVR